VYGIEYIVVDVLVSSRYEHSALQLQLVLLPLLLLHDLLALLILRLVLPAGLGAPVLEALPVLVLGAAQLGVSVAVAVVVGDLVVVDALQLVVVFLLVRDVQQLEQGRLQLVLVVLCNLHQQGVLDYADALLLKDTMDLGFNVFVFESLRVDEGKI
jgi:hypothetical protein